MSDITTKGKAVFAKTYENAVKILNTHTDPQVKSNPEVFACADALRKRLGLTHRRLDKLSIIHVAGSTGKGSVCAMCESILRHSDLKTGFLRGSKGIGFVCSMCENIIRHSGLKTGFLSSPHLIEFPERIRINGKPLAKTECTKYFFDLFDRLDDNNDDDINFATDAAVNKQQHSIKEGIKGQIDMKKIVTDGSTPDIGEYGGYNKVDVAVVEVGIGGIFDSTNVHRCPTVAGISMLDFDHVSLLGNTLEEIAGAKAGICKPGRPAFTIAQPENGFQALTKRAEELGVTLVSYYSSEKYVMHQRLVTKRFQTSSMKKTPLNLLSYQHINASLALQLCKTWMEEMGREGIKFQKGIWTQQLTTKKPTSAPTSEPFALPETFIQGLKNVYWPGRTQTIKRNNVTYYIDGAPTPKSIVTCLEWFNEQAQKEEKSIGGHVVKVLVFNIRGDRDYETLIRSFMPYHFHDALFCPSVLQQDDQNLPLAKSSPCRTNSYSDQISKCMELASCYTTLSAEPEGLPSPKASVLPSVQSAIDHIAELGKLTNMFKC